MKATVKISRIPNHFRDSNSNAGAFALYIEGGIFEIKIAAQCRLVSCGATIYIPKNIHFEIKALNPSASGWLMVLPNDDLQNLSNDLTFLRPSELMIAICRRLGQEPSEKSSDPTRSHLESALLYEIEALSAAAHTDLPLPQNPSLAAIAIKIKEAPEDMESINHWAAESAMSRRTFTQKFKEETGLTFLAWRQRVKLNSALDLLSSGLSVSETAIKLGYSNVSTFNNLFRKEFGEPPKKYLRSLKKSV
jgi:AraC-like DNA-binding protein